MLPPSSGAPPEAIKIKAYPSPQHSGSTTLVNACAVQPSYTLRSFEPTDSDEEKPDGVHVSREQVRHVDYASSRSTLHHEP